MRLTPEQIRVIRECTAQVFGADTRIWLFGSRVDDAKRGGDIDLYLETDEVIAQRVEKLCRLEAMLIMKFGDRKLDVLLKDATMTTQKIHEVAKVTGVRL